MRMCNSRRASNRSDFRRRNAPILSNVSGHRDRPQNNRFGIVEQVLGCVDHGLRSQRGEVVACDDDAVEIHPPPDRREAPLFLPVTSSSGPRRMFQVSCVWRRYLDQSSSCSTHHSSMRLGIQVHAICGPATPSSRRAASWSGLTIMTFDGPVGTNLLPSSFNLPSIWLWKPQRKMYCACRSAAGKEYPRKTSFLGVLNTSVQRFQSCRNTGRLKSLR